MDVAIPGQRHGQGAVGGAATGPSPTDRGKLGTKRHTLTDQRGAPLAVVITGANCHDMKAAAQTLDRVIVKRPRPTVADPQHLCLDKGYDFPEIAAAVCARRYRPHIRHRGEDVPLRKRHPARRWVVERTASWHNRFRKLLIRFEKRTENYLGLVHFACCLIVYRLIALG
jgi:putative transposase